MLMERFDYFVSVQIDFK